MLQSLFQLHKDDFYLYRKIILKNQEYYNFKIFLFLFVNSMQIVERVLSSFFPIRRWK